MDIRGLPPNENGLPPSALEHSRQLSRTDSNENVRPRHLRNAAKTTDRLSSELVRLTAKLKRAPEVREDEVSRVRERLKTGFYLSREAAEQTAKILVNR